ncbi:MAG TPA: MFS transporter [Chloroflexota bacterium]|jgi:MFS family permease|nr:MFS transporter [Chloroflexota bacterium]
MKLDENTKTLITLYIPSSIVSISQGMVVPTTPALAASFGVLPALAAQVVTANLLGRMLVTLPSGILIDRLGRKPAMIGGPILIVLGSILTVITPSFTLLVVAQLLSGAGAAIWALGREIAAIDLIRPNQRGRILALFFGINSAGSALGPVIGGVVTDWYGYRAVFLIAMLFSMGVIGLSAMIPETGKHAPRTQSSMFDFGRLSDIDPMYRVTFIVVVLATFAQMIRMTVVNAMLPLRVETELGFSATEVGALFGIIGMVNLIVMGPAGWVSDRFGRKAATIPAAVLTAVSFLAYPFATDMWTLSAISVLIGIASGFALGAMTVYTYDIVPDHARGRLQALRRTLGEVGGLGGPVLAAAVAAATGPGFTFLVFAPLHLVSALLLAFVAVETAGRSRVPAVQSR